MAAEKQSETLHRALISSFDEWKGPIPMTDTQAPDVVVTEADRALYIALGVFRTCTDQAILEWGWADESEEMKAIVAFRLSSQSAMQSRIAELEALAKDACDFIEAMIDANDYVGTGDGRAAKLEEREDRETLAEFRATLSTPPAPEQPDAVGELVEALEPFAEMAKHLDDTQQRRDALFCGGSPGLLAEITQHDYHRARDLVTKYRSGDA